MAYINLSNQCGDSGTRVVEIIKNAPVTSVGPGYLLVRKALWVPPKWVKINEQKKRQIKKKRNQLFSACLLKIWFPFRLSILVGQIELTFDFIRQLKLKYLPKVNLTGSLRMVCCVDGLGKNLV